MQKKTDREKAVDAARKILGRFARGTKIAVYQFPAGHWGYCTGESAIYRNLCESDHIYPGVKAQQWETRYL